ncbi:MAG: hypothetical protein EBW53_02695 [Actinobacteria bacterium]|nr:hypothetical protein [Actinomycetota bacterium]
MPKAVQTSLSLHEVARRLKVHYMTAYRYVRSGRLPAQQHDGEYAGDELAPIESLHGFFLCA